MSDLDEIKRKVLALQELADPERGASAEEAANAVAAISRILMRHNLSMAEVSTAAERISEIIGAEVDIDRSLWKPKLAAALAEAMLCRAMRSVDHETGEIRILFFGAPGNLETCVESFHWLIQLIRDRAEAVWDDARHDDVYAMWNKREWMASFRFGFIDGISVAYRQARDEVERERDPARAAAGEEVNPSALVAINTELDEKIAEWFPDVPEADIQLPDGADIFAYQDGWHEGRKVNPDRQVGSGFGNDRLSLEENTHASTQ